MEIEKIISTSFKEDTLDIRFIDENARKENIKLVDLFKKSKIKDLHEIGDKLGPIDLCFDEYGILLLVNSNDDSIFKIDLENKVLINMAKVGRHPVNVKVYKDKIYILNSDSNAISVLDNKEFKLIENINIGENPIDMLIDKLRDNIYTLNLQDFTINIISLREKSNRQIDLKGQPRKIILENHSIFILTNSIEDWIEYSEIKEFRTSDNKLIKVHNIRGVFYNFVKLTGQGIFYLINYNDGYLYKFNSINNVLEKYIYIGGISSKIICIDPKRLYINNLLKNEIISINTLERKIKSRIKVGKDPQGFILL